MLNHDQNFGELEMPESLSVNAVAGGVERVRPDAGLPYGIPAGPEPQFEPKAIDPERLAEATRRKAEAEAKMAVYRQRAKDEEMARQARLSAWLEKEKQSRELAWQERGAKLDSAMGEIVTRQKAAGLPVGNDGRIDMVAYAGKPMYEGGVVQKDLGLVGGTEANFANQSKIGGEFMEKFTSAVIAKYLPEISCVRTCKFDDYDPTGRKQGADSVLYLDGQAVALLDETMKDNLIGKNIDNKVGKVDRLNGEGGGKLKYSFGQQNGKTTLRPDTDLPVYAFGLDTATMNAGIDNFTPNKPGNDAEKRAAYGLIYSLHRQTDRINAQIDEGRVGFKGAVGRANFCGRLDLLQQYLEKKMPRKEVEEYLEAQMLKARGTSKKGPHKRKVTRR
ncbi:MAG: hypothetical protein MUD10_00800 [Candidatus Pacebacteria bacterium]|jgi:hypothetical protein|nr:hypothetical protein [Candidatus Paceibacterota bacterium]